MALNTSIQETPVIEGNSPNVQFFCDTYYNEENNPQDVQLCRICFATDGNLHSLKVDKDLDQAYGTLTGLSIENEDNMPPYLCTECSNQLMCSIHFRTRSLRAHLFLLEILRKHNCITLEKIKSVNECQDFNPSNINITDNSGDQYNLKTIQIKKENLSTDENIDIRDESSPTGDITIDVIKKEDDDMFNQADDKNIDIVYSYALHDGIGDIKVEIDDVYNDDIIEKDIVIDDLMYNDSFGGEDESDSNIEDQRHTTKLHVATVKRVSKTKVTKSLKYKSENRLLVYDNLCCDVCPYKTVSDVKLLRHLKTHSSKAYMNSYKTNIGKKVKSSELRFSCHVCEKIFSKKWGLQKHMKIHSGEKQYQCGICKKAFNENRDLTNHLRTHSGEKPFGCDLCKKSFSERGNLLRHIRIHAGEKPFSCKICKISFSQKHHLKRHLTIH